MNTTFFPYRRYKNPNWIRWGIAGLTLATVVSTLGCGGSRYLPSTPMPQTRADETKAPVAKPEILGFFEGFSGELPLPNLDRPIPLDLDWSQAQSKPVTAHTLKSSWLVFSLEESADQAVTPRSKSIRSPELPEQKASQKASQRPSQKHSKMPPESTLPEDASLLIKVTRVEATGTSPTLQVTARTNALLPGIAFAKSDDLLPCIRHQCTSTGHYEIQTPDERAPIEVRFQPGVPSGIEHEFHALPQPPGGGGHLTFLLAEGIPIAREVWRNPTDRTLRVQWSTELSHSCRQGIVRTRAEIVKHPNFEQCFDRFESRPNLVLKSNLPVSTSTLGPGESVEVVWLLVAEQLGPRLPHPGEKQWAREQGQPSTSPMLFPVSVGDHVAWLETSWKLRSNYFLRDPNPELDSRSDPTEATIEGAFSASEPIRMGITDQPRTFGAAPHERFGSDYGARGLVIPY